MGEVYRARDSRLGRDVAVKILALDISSDPVCAYEVATVHAALGDTKATMEWLEKGYRKRADCMPWIHSDPKLAGCEAMQDSTT